MTAATRPGCCHIDWAILNTGYNLVQPIEAELVKQLSNLRHTAAMLEAVMQGDSMPADFDNLKAAIELTQRQR